MGAGTTAVVGPSYRHRAGRDGTAAATQGDTASKEDNENMVSFAVETDGKLNYAVNNAGIGGPAAPAGETGLEAWDKVIAINLSGVLYGMRYQIPEMLKTEVSQLVVFLLSDYASFMTGGYTVVDGGYTVV